MLNGINAFKRGLAEGLQRSDGLFLYSLSQIDPRYDRPGDPPYLQTNSFRKSRASTPSFRPSACLSPIASPAIRWSKDACARALNYWWRAEREERVYTYRSYAVKTFGIAAGEIDLRYAFNLPHLLRRPRQLDLHLSRLLRLGRALAKQEVWPSRSKAIRLRWSPCSCRVTRRPSVSPSSTPAFLARRFRSPWNSTSDRSGRSASCSIPPMARRSRSYPALKTTAG